MSNQINSNVIGNINQNGALSSAKNSASEDLSKNFMTLFIAQLQNQDPLKPLENAELTSQLAQINMVNGIEGLSDKMTSITNQIQAGNQLQTQLQATALIGHGVLVPGNKVLVGNGETTPFGIELDSKADKARVTITNSNGEVVREYELTNMDAGTESFMWDGKNAQGEVVGDGAYQFKIEASIGGKPVAAQALNYAVVTGVSSTPSGTQLDLGGAYGRVALTDVRQVISIN